MRIIIIGGVAGGMSAATRLRRLQEDAEIIVLERSGYVSFANCGLPYYVGGVIEERSALLLNSPESLAARFGIDVRVDHEVVGIDRQRKTVSVRRSADGSTEELSYDALVLSPGATPVRPPIPGIDRALVLRDIEDTDAIATAVDEARTAVVIGGGFIGVEMAENLLERGLSVTLVEAADQLLAPLDPEMAALVHERVRARGIRLELATSVTAVAEKSVRTSAGDVIDAEPVIAAIGVRPDIGLARDAGLAIGERGGIAVDEQLRTSDPNIYAVGDAVEKRDGLSGESTLVPLANIANRQGRFVADVISGEAACDRAAAETAIVGVLGLQVASTGWNEKRLRAAGRPYRAIHTHPASHAGYYPGAAGMSLKLLVDPDTDAILGAQGIGEDGVDKRIDVIATAIAANLPASRLADLELSYAPQFGSAKDPVNMLGYIARNLREGKVETVQWDELDVALAAGGHLIDVRTRAEYDAGHLPGARLIPVDELRDRLDELPDGDLIVHCAVGLRGYLAARTLMQHGRAVRNLDGGYKTWKAMNP